MTCDCPSTSATPIHSVSGVTNPSMAWLTELAVQHVKTPPKVLKSMAIIHTCGTKNKGWKYDDNDKA